MKQTQIVSREEWLSRRLALLEEEKALDRERDRVSALRRSLPWQPVVTDYVFAGADGSVTLSDLFAGHSQLIVYHFMLGEGWEAGCPSCSYLADHFDGMLAHLAARDTGFAAVSKAGIDSIEAYRRRMGWSFPWVSSSGNSFNRDYDVSFTPQELADGVRYNYRDNVKFPMEEAPGVSVFAKHDSGELFHTYSTYARGLDHLIGTYQFLDLTAKGRDEDDLPFSMAWIRRHDEYETG